MMYDHREKAVPRLVGFLVVLRGIFPLGWRENETRKQKFEFLLFVTIQRGV